MIKRGYQFIVGIDQCTNGWTCYFGSHTRHGDVVDTKEIAFTCGVEMPDGNINLLSRVC